MLSCVKLTNDDIIRTWPVPDLNVTRAICPFLREPVYGELLALESGNTLPWM